MALFSFHCQCYKKDALRGIYRHNHRLNVTYGNKDIDNSISAKNIVYITPDTTLYQSCKKQIEERVLSTGHRVTKASNWICECIYTYPQGLEKDRVNEYFGLVLEYLADKVGRNNLVSAVVHMDEASPHLHVDFLVITQDNRLSSKEVVNMAFITSIHNELPTILQKNGFDVTRGSAEHDSAGLSAREYKKKMQEESAVLEGKLKELADNYNELVDRYNELLKTLKELERKNLKKAREILNHRQISR